MTKSNDAIIVVHSSPDNIAGATVPDTFVSDTPETPCGQARTAFAAFARNSFIVRTPGVSTNGRSINFQILSHAFGDSLQD
jgi:hypothetical protein